jgi:hypothetical protein
VARAIFSRASGQKEKSKPEAQTGKEPKARDSGNALGTLPAAAKIKAGKFLHPRSTRAKICANKRREPVSLTHPKFEMTSDKSSLYILHRHSIPRLTLRTDSKVTSTAHGKSITQIQAGDYRSAAPREPRHDAILHHGDSK